MSSEVLASQASAGDEAALATLIERHSRYFYHLGYRLLSNEQEAEDVVQEAYIKLWTGKAKWELGKGAKFVTWFHRIVHNACIDRMRRASSKVLSLSPVMESQLQAKDQAADDRIEEEQQANSVKEALERLPERQRTALMYVYYSDLKQKEIAEMMEVSLKALESLLARGKANLRNVILSEQPHVAAI